MINRHWLAQPISRTNFHGRKGDRGTEVRLYIDFKRYMESLEPNQFADSNSIQ